MCASTSCRSATTSESSQWITSPVAAVSPALRALALPGVSQTISRVPGGRMPGRRRAGLLPLSTTTTSISFAG